MVQAVKIGKGSQAINAELESVLAELEVKCKTETAEVYIDGEFNPSLTPLVKISVKFSLF
jgi:hypothetical protein